MRFRFLTMTIAVGVIVGLAKRAELQAAEPSAVKPLVILTGNDSAVAKPAIERCLTSKEWQTVWHRHRNGSELDDLLGCPEIDFTACFVLAFFDGTSTIPPTFRIEEIIEDENVVRIRYHFTSGQIIFNPGEKLKETRSYAFAVFSATKKTIVLSTCGFPPCDDAAMLPRS